MKRPLLIVVLLGCLAAAVGCGVTTEDTPVPLTTSSTTPQAIPTTTQQPDSTTPVQPSPPTTGTSASSTGLSSSPVPPAGDTP